MAKQGKNRLKFLMNRTSLFFFLIFGVHFVVAVIYKEVVGVDIAANPRFRPWDWWWQTIPVDLLLNRLWESIWYLHAQPPLYNLYGAFFFNLFSDDPLSAMQYGNIFFGSLIPALFFLTLNLMTGRRWLSFLVGLYLALDAGLFLFEAYMLYDLLTAFLVAVSVCLFAYYEKTHQPRYAYLFILALNILVLLRSAYHILILPIAIILIYFASGVRAPKYLYFPSNDARPKETHYLASTKDRLRFVGIVILLCLFSIGWYEKNAIMYGFFGASSWQGFSMWEIQSTSFSEESLHELAEEGVVDPIVAELPGYSLPSQYQVYGFDEVSNIPLLNRDDFHNINVIKIARVYQQSAISLLFEHPKAYLNAVKQAYLIYNSPTAQFRHHILNIQKIQRHADLTAKIFQGQILEDILHIRFGSFYSILIPFSLLLFGYSVVYTSLQFKRNIFTTLISTPTELWMLFLITYTTLIGVFLEIGENNRERFYIEQLVIVFVIVVLGRLFILGRSNHTMQKTETTND